MSTEAERPCSQGGKHEVENIMAITTKSHPHPFSLGYRFKGFCVKCHDLIAAVKRDEYTGFEV